MFKYIMLLLGLCLTGCQTTTTGDLATEPAMQKMDRNEKLLLRIDKIVGTYDVVVQRAVHNGTDPKNKDQWSIIGSSSVSGYPGAFRTEDESMQVEDFERKGSFLLDGTRVEISLEPGARLVVKVIPELQNTARVVGVYVQVIPLGEGYETFSMPFDVSCDIGEVLQLYGKVVPLVQELPAEELSESMPEKDA